MNINKLLDHINKKKINGALFFSSENVKDVNLEYFSDFKEPTFSFLLLTEDSSTLITSSIDYERALKESNVDEIINLKQYKYKLLQILKEKLKKKNIGIVYQLFPYSYIKKLKGFKFFDISDIVYNIRSIKEKKEIELIKKACRITNMGIKYFEKNVSTELTEKELSLMLEEYLKKKNIDGMSFKTILTSGKRSAFIHPYPSVSNKKISIGLGLIDFGIKYKRYCSDVTVPFSIGKLNENQKRIKNTIKNTYCELVNFIREGIYAHEIYELAEKLINKNGFELKHSIGHGIGLEVHDLPFLSPKPTEKNELKKYKPTMIRRGMVITIEPGIYEANIGGCRLENDVLINKRRVSILTKGRMIEI